MVGDVPQMCDEMKILSRADKMAVLKDLEFKVEIPALTGVSMKADLGVPWNKLRIMKRYVLLATL